MNPYAVIAALCGIIILSYVFHLISQKTRIPSVLMLIGLGMAIKFSFEGRQEFLVKNEVLSILKILGNVGLVMIVLEAALDLKLRRENQKMVWLSLLSAFLCLSLSLAAITSVIYFFPGIYGMVPYRQICKDRHPCQSRYYLKNFLETRREGLM